MDVRAIANVIDDMHRRKRCDVMESRVSITLSGLSAEDASTLQKCFLGTDWQIAILDSSESELGPETPSEHFSPYRVVVTKPNLDDQEEIYVLSQRGFEQLLNSGGVFRVWHVAGLSTPFNTLLSSFVTWEGEGHVDICPPLKNPRDIVRESGEVRKTPADLRPWLTRSQWIGDDRIFQTWAEVAAKQVLFSLCDEVTSHPSAVVFRGPPKRIVEIPERSLLQALEERGFLDLQTAALWVFENPAETEMRHVLWAAELARWLSRSNVSFECFTAGDAGSALEGAKIAYQLGISKLSSDTLKMLTDLRKSVLDEASKVSDATRQLVGAIATTLSVGIGLVAARIAASANAVLVAALSVVITIYVLSVIWAGRRAINLQSTVRANWKDRTYGFMSDAEYKRLVDDPADDAAATFYSAARVGAYLTIAFCFVVVWSLLSM